MTAWSDAAEHAVVAGLEAAADADDAVHMAAYMRDQFPFYGVKSPACADIWRAVKRDADGVHGRAGPDDLLDFADAMWGLDEREHQYVAAKALGAAGVRRNVGGFTPDHLDRLRQLIITKSWWDTVDVIAPRIVGPLALAYPAAVVPVLDDWLVDDDMWLIRTAIIHQLRAKQDTDVDRLSHACMTAASHPDFFIRKAIGWALRQYSYIDAAWVEAFVDEHADVLSGLSRREAMKAIERQRRSAAGHGAP